MKDIIEIITVIIFALVLIVPSIYLLIQHIGLTVKYDLNSDIIQKDALKMLKQNEGNVCISTKYMDYFDNWNIVTLYNDILNNTNNLRQLVIISLLTGALLLIYGIFLIIRKHNNTPNKEQFKNFTYLLLMSVPLFIIGMGNRKIGTKVVCNIQNTSSMNVIKVLFISGIVISSIIFLYGIIRLF